MIEPYQCKIDISLPMRPIDELLLNTQCFGFSTSWKIHEIVTLVGVQVGSNCEFLMQMHKNENSKKNVKL